jgi:sulfur dioxygenase
VLGCAQTKEALLIDPVLENFDRDVSLLEELQLDLKATVDSHVHADHISGASAHRLRGSQVLMPKKAGAVIIFSLTLLHLFL